MLINTIIIIGSLAPTVHGSAPYCTDNVLSLTCEYRTPADCFRALQAFGLQQCVHNPNKERRK